MKSLNIDNSYSLDNVDNYYKELKHDINEIVNKYVDLIKEYLNFIYDNVKIKNKFYIKFIVKRGLETITNVFLNIFYYTKNLNLTYYHCQKSFYFYVEFIGQITDEQNTYLQLSSRDAATYVYRKTIFEINNEFKKKIPYPSEEISSKFDLLNIYIDLYKFIAIKIINQNKNYNTETKTININDNLIKINSKIKNIIFNLSELKNIILLINILDNKLKEEEKFIEIVNYYFKKINKNTNLTLKLYEKIKNEDFYIYLNDNTDKLVNWLID